MKIKENYIMEGGLGRLWQHTKDKKTFAIIGSQYKTDKSQHPDELLSLIKDYARNTDGVGFNYINGSYVYKDGTTSAEKSLIVYNIDKQTALDIADKLKQETIVWKDQDFFGIITVPNGKVDMTFVNDNKNLKFNRQAIIDAEGSSAIVGKQWKKHNHNSEQEFVFEAYLNVLNRETHSRDLYLLCRESVGANKNCVPIFSISEALRECNHLDDNNVIVENSNRYRRVNKALFGDPSGKIRTFALISVDNPVGLFTGEERKVWNDAKRQDKVDLNSDSREIFRNTTLLHKIEAAQHDGKKAMGYGGFDYVEIKGHYGESEKSYMIFNLTFDDAKIIASSYGQESFFFGKVSAAPEKEPSTIAYYETNDGCKTYRRIEISKTITYETDAKDFFSKYGIKFKINMKVFGDNVTPIKNQGMFEESFTRTTFMERGRARRWSRE